MDKPQLHELWIALFAPLDLEEKQIENVWLYLLKQYGGRGRAYHNLTHISTMMSLWQRHKVAFQDSDILAFSIFFHDIIYNPLRKDNELKSAEYASTILQKAGVDQERTQHCYQQILLTKSHQGPDLTQDAKYLLDFDLEILGRDWEAYEVYTQQIRREYRIYPWPIYKKGRKAVLKHFLELPHIYQTPHFQQSLESKARENLKKELHILSS
ncbi:MAG: hypothetical protein AAGC85_21960 [Bacteroidota bacterium]